MATFDLKCELSESGGCSLFEESEHWRNVGMGVDDLRLTALMLILTFIQLFRAGRQDLKTGATLGVGNGDDITSISFTDV